MEGEGSKYVCFSLKGTLRFESISKGRINRKVGLCRSSYTLATQGTPLQLFQSGGS